MFSSLVGKILEENGSPFQCSLLENSPDREEPGKLQSTVHGITKWDTTGRLEHKHTQKSDMGNSLGSLLFK